MYTLRCRKRKLDADTMSSPKRAKADTANQTTTSLLVLCRDVELAEISRFINDSITNQQPGALYICGAPGTGKTTCLKHILESSENLKSIDVVVVNCMTIQRPQAIFSVIAEKLGSHVPRGQEALVKSINSRKAMTVIVLDEIDSLDCKRQEVLYTLFEWPALPKSKVVLIGIANALDLTDRVLPRLHSYTCQPQLLHFAPYTIKQIVTIMQKWLDSEETNAVIDPMAMQFCGRKVAASNGDLRKAFDVCRRAVELARTQKRECDRKPLRVTLSDMAKIYNGSTSTTLTEIPFQQQLLLCALIAVTKKSKKMVTVAVLYEEYKTLCEQRKLKRENETEFMSLCNILASCGILCLKKAKETRHTKVMLKLEESELRHFLHKCSSLSAVMDTGM